MNDMIGYHVYFFQLWGTDHHPDDVEPAIRQSLADLNLDYFDAYLIHWPTPFVVSNPIAFLFSHSNSFFARQKDGTQMWPKDEEGHFRLADEIEPLDTWKAMEKLVEKGLTRALGLSNFNSQQMQILIDNSNTVPAILHAECNPRFSNEALQ